MSHFSFFFRFVHYQHFDAATEFIVLRHVRVAQSVDQLVLRLVAAGFDLASAHPDARTRTLVGRCWRLLRTRGRDTAADEEDDVFGEPEHIGTLWDYPGQIACLEFQFAAGEMCRDSVRQPVTDMCRVNNCL